MKYLLAFLLLCLSAVAHGTIYWEEDFEGNLNTSGYVANPPSGTQYDPWYVQQCSSCGALEPFYSTSGNCANADNYHKGCNPGISTDVAHSGTHSLRYDYTGGTSPYNGIDVGTYVARNFTDTNDLYVRFYVRFSTNYSCCVFNTGIPDDPHNGLSKFFYIRDENYPRATDSTRDFDFIPRHNYGQNIAVLTELYNSGGQSYIMDMEFGFENDTWYCVEFHIKVNTPGTANGYMEGWIDGSNTHQVTGLLFAYGATDPDTVNHLRFLAQSADNGYRYYDDVAVGNERIGCSAPPPAPPSKPTGVHMSGPASM